VDRLLDLSNYSIQARSCPYAKNQLLAHHFGKKNQLLALKNIITDMGRIPLFSVKLIIIITCFICNLVEAVKKSEVVINQLSSERNDQSVWDPIVI
jgi:hypothetical protein